jgi:hypothetical protein
MSKNSTPSPSWRLHGVAGQLYFYFIIIIIIIISIKLVEISTVIGGG